MEGETGTTLAADRASLDGSRSGGWGATRGWGHLAGQPPRWFFHLVLAVPTLLLVWVAGLPGGGFFPGLPYVAAIGLLALVWMGRVVAFCHRPCPTPRSLPWLTVAPAGAVVVLALLVADVPFDVR